MLPVKGLPIYCNAELWKPAAIDTVYIYDYDRYVLVQQHTGIRVFVRSPEAKAIRTGVTSRYPVDVEEYEHFSMALPSTQLTPDRVSSDPQPPVQASST